MGDDHALEIVGIETVKLTMYDGTTHIIQEVRHVNDLKKNILSLGQLDEIECKTRIENEIMKIVKEAFVVIKAKKVAANLYMLQGETL